MDITDDSDPLNVTKGNPGLKPSFTNSLRLFYNTYLQNHQRAIMTYINYQNTRNSISNMVTYDEKTGGRITRPENINGNWNISGAFMFNTAIDSIGKWNINTFTNISYNNYVGYLALDNNSNSQKNITRTSQINEQLRTSYRNDWLEVMLDGSLNYTHSRNLLQSESNLDTWQFSYGGSLNIYLPWGISLSTDLHENSRRGFNDNSMNTNELIWNAQISQGFLKGKPLTISLQFYDILHKNNLFHWIMYEMEKRMNIAILGLGTVGSGACEAVKSAIDLEVTRILVRRPKPEYADLQTEDIDDILNDPNIDLVAECIGGIHPALEYVLGAMEHGKHVVTANKALVSAHFEELENCARKYGVQFRFTPSAGGGIPWLYNLQRAGRCDTIEEVHGVVNGTCNYILDLMHT